MSESTTLRPETPADAAAVRRVLVEAFPTADEADLVEALRASGRLTIGLVACDAEHEVVGTIAFSPITIEGVEVGLGLAPLAVAERARKRGVGAQLVRAGLEACEQHGAALCVVLGDPHYYARFGFVPAYPHGLTDEYGGGDAFQVLALRPGALTGVRGRVAYAPEFAVL